MKRAARGAACARLSLLLALGGCEDQERRFRDVEAAGDGCGAPAWSLCPPSGPCVILPVGDSLTDGAQAPGAYRPALYRDLRARGLCVRFVGSRIKGTPELVAEDQAYNEGYVGKTIRQVDDALKISLASLPRFHVALVHLGTNDILQGTGEPEAGGRMSALLDTLWARSPEAAIVVARILPTRVPLWEERAVVLSASVKAMVDARALAGQRVYWVDMHDAVDTSPDSPDMIPGHYVHLSYEGYAKEALRWERLLLPLLW